MSAKRLYLLLLFSSILVTSCKKDLVHFIHIQRLDSHTTTDRLNRIMMVNDRVGFIVGGQRFLNATILMTRDGGTTWSYTSFPAAGKGLYGISQAPGGIIYACGFEGKLLYSTDTGQTWILRSLGGYLYTDIAFPDATHGMAVGGISFNSGNIAYFDNNGMVNQTDSLAIQWNRIKMIDKATGYLIGYGAIKKTTDGGRTWSFTQIKGDDFTGLATLNNGNELWACGYNGCIFHSSNGGSNWEELRDGNDVTRIRYHLEDILFIDVLHGWAVGEDGVVIYTDDGGHHWSLYNSFTSNGLYSVIVCANGDLLVAGDNGALYRLQLP